MTIFRGPAADWHVDYTSPADPASMISAEVAFASGEAALDVTSGPPRGGDYLDAEDPLPVVVGGSVPRVVGAHHPRGVVSS